MSLLLGLVSWHRRLLASQSTIANRQETGVLAKDQHGVVMPTVVWTGLSAGWKNKIVGTAPSGSTYHGRGPKQLSWDYNYKAFSLYYCGDDTLLNYPERVAENSELAWASSIWFWVTGGPDNFKPGCHNVFTRAEGEGNRKPGLGWVINVVNGGLECNSNVKKCDRRVASRVAHYEHYCSKFGVAPLKAGWTADNLYCDTQDAYR